MVMMFIKNGNGCGPVSVVSRVSEVEERQFRELMLLLLEIRLVVVLIGIRICRSPGRKGLILWTKPVYLPLTGGIS